MKCILVEDGVNSYRVNQRANLPPNIIPATVTKVGRKYFTVVRDGWPYGAEFRLDTLSQRTYYCPDYSFHLSTEDYLKQFELNKKRGEITSWFRGSFGGNTSNLTEQDVETILSVIEKYK